MQDQHPKKEEFTLSSYMHSIHTYARGMSVACVLTGRPRSRFSVPHAILPRGKYSIGTAFICSPATIITAVTGVCVVALSKTYRYAPLPIMHAIIIA
jgi:hypothetical protein